MERRAKLAGIWAVLGILIAILLIALGPPLATAWRCYELNANGERADAEVVGKNAQVGLVLEITSGSQRGLVCTAKTSVTQLERAEPGDVLAVVLPDGKPGDCVLAATLENSAALLWALSGTGAAVLLLIVLIGLFVQRSFTAPGTLTSALDGDPKDMTCPQCGRDMAEGYLPLLAGLHWREIGDPIRVPHALAGLPGTVGWRGRPRLHAFRCEPCEIITFRYGKP
jgi:hypothetical protein